MEFSFGPRLSAVNIRMIRPSINHHTTRRGQAAVLVDKPTDPKALRRCGYPHGRTHATVLYTLWNPVIVPGNSYDNPLCSSGATWIKYPEREDAWMAVQRHHNILIRDARLCQCACAALIAVCKIVGVGLCAPPSLLVLAPRKLGAMLSNVDRQCI